jgi:hypothetical protein
VPRWLNNRNLWLILMALVLLRGVLYLIYG